MDEVINILVILIGNIIAFVLPTIFVVVTAILIVLKSKGTIFKGKYKNKDNTK